jgi:hypothetical protein
MKREYDFSKGLRGKFYRKGAKLCLPIYLDAKVQELRCNRSELRVVIPI